MVSLIPPPAPAPPVAAINPIVAVTGHRPPQLGGYKIPNPIYDQVVFGLAAAFEKFKPSIVMTGMALGTDQWAAEVCVNMGIPFAAIIPFNGQEKIWPPQSQAKYHWLLQQAHTRILISSGGFTPSAMQKRNEYMINNCHQVVAAFNGSSGGTANCLAYAFKMGKPVHYVPLTPQGMVVGKDLHSAQEAPKETEKLEPTDPKAKRVLDL